MQGQNQTILSSQPKRFSLFSSSHSAQLDGVVVVGLLEDHRRRDRADRREPAEASIARHLVVSESHGRGPRVHRLRSQQSRRTHFGQVRLFTNV